MSRVGNAAIKIPSGVTVSQSGQLVEVKGSQGALSYLVPDFLAIDKDNDVLKVRPLDSTKQARMMWGTARRTLANIVQGVHEGFKLNLEITGTGYRASVQGNELVLQLGFSHDVRFPIPKGITIKTEKPTSVQVMGPDKQQVGQVAAEIRSYRPPEPYKGKGVIRENEYVVRKEGKKK